MAQKINWKNHFVELLVVIIGISIAFSLNSWNENNKDKKLERKYIKSLTADLENDLNELNRLRDTSAYFLKMNLGLIKVLHTQNYDHDSLFHFVLGLYSLDEFVSRDNTYESLKASGNLEIISDFDLKNEITTLYNQYYKEIHTLDELHSESIFKEISPFINRNVQFTRNPVILNKDFLNDNFFRNKTYSAYYFLNKKFESYSVSIERAEALINKLKKVVES